MPVFKRYPKMKIAQTISLLILSLGCAFGQTKLEEEVKGKSRLLAKVKSISKLGVSEEDYFISSESWPVPITINRGKRLISIVIRLDDTRREGFDDWNYFYRSEKPETDLPRKIMIPDAKRPKITAWMKSKGFKSEIAYWQIKQNGSIEAYYTFFSAYIKGEKTENDASEVVEYLIDEIFESKEDTYKFTTIKRG